MRGSSPTLNEPLVNNNGCYPTFDVSELYYKLLVYLLHRMVDGWYEYEVFAYKEKNPNSPCSIH